MNSLGMYHEIKDIDKGLLKCTLHQKPIAFEKNGYFKRIDFRMLRTDDPNFPLGIDSFMQFRVKDKLAGNSSLVHIGHGKSHVRYTPLNTNNVNGTLTSTGIIFKEAWDNADFELVNAGHLIRKNIHLHTGHPRSFSFRIDDHSNFDPVTLQFADDFKILQPWLENPDGLRIDLSWLVTQKGNKTILTVNLPDGDYNGWVLDPATYVIQPAMSDTYISGVNQTTLYNTSTLFNVGMRTSTGENRIGLINFPWSSGAPDEFYSATVKLTITSKDASANGNHAFRPLKKNWNENACWTKATGVVLWETPGAVGASDYDSSHGPFAVCAMNSAADGQPTVKSFLMNNTDYTPVRTVGELFPSGYYGWRVNGYPDGGWQYASSDHATASWRPKLEISYPSRRVNGVSQAHYVNGVHVPTKVCGVN